MTKQRWSGQGQLALMVDRIQELKTGGQCFPLNQYDDAPAASEQSLQTGLFDVSTRPQRQCRENHH